MGNEQGKLQGVPTPAGIQSMDESLQRKFSKGIQYNSKSDLASQAAVKLSLSGYSVSLLANLKMLPISFLKLLLSIPNNTHLFFTQ